MKVRATAKGYFDGVREPGDVFDVPDSTEKKSSWFVVLDEKPEPKDENQKRNHK